MLRSLCVSDMTEIVCSSKYPIPESSTYTITDITEMLENFQIEFTNPESIDSSKNPYIALELCKEFSIHSNINIDKNTTVRGIDTEKLEEKEKQLTAKKEKCFLDFLFIQCVESVSLILKNKAEIFGEEGSLIKEIIQNNLKDINRIFLLSKIEMNEHKEFVIGCFLSCAAEKKIKLSPDSSVQHFTSNIIGSASSGSSFTGLSLLKPLLYTGYAIKIYPSLSIPTNVISRYVRFGFVFSYYQINYMLYTRSTKVLIRFLKEYDLKCSIGFSMFGYRSEISSIFDYLFKDNSADLLKILFNRYLNTDKPSDKVYMHGAFFTCFVIACQRKKEHPTLILDLYDQINSQITQDDYYHTYDISNFLNFYKKNSKDFSEVMTDMQEDLVEREGDREKFYKVLKFFNPNLEIEETQIENVEIDIFGSIRDIFSSLF